MTARHVVDVDRDGWVARTFQGGALASAPQVSVHVEFGVGGASGAVEVLREVVAEVERDIAALASDDSGAPRARWTTAKVTP